MWFSGFGIRKDSGSQFGKIPSERFYLPVMVALEGNIPQTLGQPGIMWGIQRYRAVWFCITISFGAILPQEASSQVPSSSNWLCTLWCLRVSSSVQKWKLWRKTRGKMAPEDVVILLDTSEFAHCTGLASKKTGRKSSSNTRKFRSSTALRYGLAISCVRGQ